MSNKYLDVIGIILDVIIAIFSLFVGIEQLYVAFTCGIAFSTLEFTFLIIGAIAYLVLTGLLIFMLISIFKRYKK